MEELPDRVASLNRALTAPELAGILNMHPASIYRLATSGELPHYRIGSAVRFDCRAVAKYLKEQLQ